jgi:hypothetical protein
MPLMMPGRPDLGKSRAGRQGRAAWSNRSAPSAWRIWSTSAASSRRCDGHARRPTRRRRSSAAPASSAARSAFPSTNANRANPAQAQGHELGAAGGQAQVQRLLQQGLGVLQPPLYQGQAAQQHLGGGGEPGVVEPNRQVARLGQVAQRVVVAAHGRLQGAEGEARRRGAKGLGLAPELLKGGRRLPQGAV